MNITNIRKAIYTIGATVSGSGFYYEEAPDSTNYPYIVYHLIDSVHQRIAVGTSTDDILIQFNIIDRRISTNGKKISSAPIEIVADDLQNKFDVASIGIDGFGTLKFNKTLITPSTIIEDGNYWQVVVRYNLLIAQ